jgi:hypothetical protein
MDSLKFRRDNYDSLHCPRTLVLENRPNEFVVKDLNQKLKLNEQPICTISE